jgi:hypothetical protein
MSVSDHARFMSSPSFEARTQTVNLVMQLRVAVGGR